MKNNKIQFNLDFGGFYESIHEWHIENKLLDLYNFANDTDQEDFYDDVLSNFRDSINYNEVQNQYCTQWLNHFNMNFNTWFTFKGIDSPKYYNFETDTIICEVSEGYIDDIINFKDDNLVDFINEVSRSCSGFTSFYEGWDQVITNKAVFMNYYTRWLLSIDEHWIDDVNERLFDGLEIDDTNIYIQDKAVNYD